MAAFVAARKSEFLGGEWASDELAVALRCGRGRVLGQVQLAEIMQTRLPATWAAWRAGDIDGYKANKVAETAGRLVDRLCFPPSTPLPRPPRPRRPVRSCRPG
jgi:hypothetical protein